MTRGRTSSSSIRENFPAKYAGRVFSLHRPEVEAHAALCGVGAGWHGIIDRLVSDLFTLGWDGMLADVKEKFGGLRFYIGEESLEMSARIDEAESESFQTCEECGAPGKARTGSWVKTLCDTHAEARYG